MLIHKILKNCFVENTIVSVLVYIRNLYYKLSAWIKNDIIIHIRRFQWFFLNQFHSECITFPPPYNLHSPEILRAYSISLFIYRNVRRSIFLSFFIRIANNSAKTERETIWGVFRARFRSPSFSAPDAKISLSILANATIISPILSAKFAGTK